MDYQPINLDLSSKKGTRAMMKNLIKNAQKVLYKSRSSAKKGYFKFHGFFATEKSNYFGRNLLSVR